MRFLIRIAANALGVLLASLAVPGFAFAGNLKTLIGIGLALALANIIVRPLLKLFRPYGNFSELNFAQVGHGIGCYGTRPGTAQPRRIRQVRERRAWTRWFS